MKKVISFLSAVALIASTFVAMTTVATATTGAPTLRYDVTYDNAETPYAVGATGLISIYCDNLDLVSMDDMDTYFSGIDSVGIKATLNTEYATSKKLQVKSPALSNSTINYSNGLCTVQWATTNYDSMVYNMDKALCTIKFTIQKELVAPVAVTFTECNIKTTRYDEDGNKLGQELCAQAGMAADKELLVPTLTVGPESADDEGDSAITTKNDKVGVYGEKTLKLIAEVLDTVDATKKVAIVKNGTERQESGRTLAEIVNGVSVGGSKITGKLAVGVLTTDESAVFTFELY